MRERDISSVGLQFFNLELKKKKDLLDSFTYNCSHSIRSPLKSIEGLVGLLKEHPEVAGDGSNYRALLKTEAERLQSIVFHFNELRINAEKDVCPRVIDVEMLLARVIHPFRSQLLKDDISLQTHINQKGDLITDSSRLEPILTELITNAIQFQDHTKEKKEIWIYVTASPSSCSIQVHDNGIGIRENDARKVFGLFFRGSVSSRGSGLGLFVVSQLVEKLGGSISVQAIPERGTIFSILIPNAKLK